MTHSLRNPAGRLALPPALWPCVLCGGPFAYLNSLIIFFVLFVFEQRTKQPMPKALHFCLRNVDRHIVCGLFIHVCFAFNFKHETD